MALKTEDVVKGILELGKISEELKGFQRNIDEAKQQKAQLDKDIFLFRKIRQEEKESLEKEEQEKEKIIAELNQRISDLQTKKDSVNFEISAERLRLAQLDEQIKSGLSNIDKENNKLNFQTDLLNKTQIEVEHKKDIIRQIKELAEKL